MFVFVELGPYSELHWLHEVKEEHIEQPSKAHISHKLLVAFRKYPLEVSQIKQVVIV
jgi:hypothetical protein